MEKQKKCSNKNHKEIEAINYCYECELHLCNKCSNYHLELFENHHVSNISKDIQDIFTGLCSEPNHKIELLFYCKSHNKLCCAACLSKIKEKGNGQHHDCDVCSIEEIKDSKKNDLNENIKILNFFSKNIEASINELKEIFNNFSTMSFEIFVPLVFALYSSDSCVPDKERLMILKYLVARYFLMNLER